MCLDMCLTRYPLSADNFANSLDPDQVQQNVGPDLELNCLTLCWYFLKKNSKEVDFEKKISNQQKSIQYFPALPVKKKEIPVQLGGKLCFSLAIPGIPA